MIYKIRITEQAANDLRDTFRYIAFELNAIMNASNQLDRLEKAIHSLEQMPERFRKYEKGMWKERGLRLMPVDNYCVFYVVNQETKTVSILRVMYGRRNMEEELNQ